MKDEEKRYFLYEGIIGIISGLILLFTNLSDTGKGLGVLFGCGLFGVGLLLIGAYYYNGLKK